jgi:hypothetical protein
LPRLFPALRGRGGGVRGAVREGGVRVIAVVSIAAGYLMMMIAARDDMKVLGVVGVVGVVVSTIAIVALVMLR